MGQRIKHFDFVSQDSPQVVFERPVMDDYPIRFREKLLSALVNGGPSISKEAVIPTGESPLTLFIIMVN